MIKNTFTLILPAYFHWLAVKLSLVGYMDTYVIFKMIHFEDWCASGNSNKNLKKNRNVEKFLTVICI